MTQNDKEISNSEKSVRTKETVLGGNEFLVAGCI